MTPPVIEERTENFREVLTNIARQARSLQENFNESNVQPIEQPMLGTGLHSDNLQLLNVGFCLDYYGVKLSTVYSLHYLISRYFVDIVTIKDKLMTEMKTDFNNCLSMVNKLPVL